MTPPTGDPARLADTIAPALAAADVAAVLVPLTGDDERALLNGLKALAPAVQGAGAALVLEGRADLVARAGADITSAWIAKLLKPILRLEPRKHEREIGGCGHRGRGPRGPHHASGQAVFLARR